MAEAAVKTEGGFPHDANLSRAAQAASRREGWSHWRDTAGIALLAVISALPYLNSLVNGFVYDDITQVMNNPYLRNFHHLRAIFTTSAWSYLGGAEAATNYYRPMMTLGYLACFQLFGARPFAFHLANLILDVAVVLLLFKLTERMFQDRALAWAAALIFALHPVHSEPVDWIAAVTDLELALFYLAAFGFYLRIPRLSAGRLRWLAAQSATLVSLALALLSKEQALTFPVLITFYEHLYREDRAQTRPAEKVARYAPAWLLVPVYLGLRVRFLGGLAPVAGHPVVASDELLLSAAALFGQYAGKLLWPARLCLYYVFPTSWTALLPQVLGGMAALVVGVLLFIVLWKRARPVSFGLIWFCLTLAPVLNVRWMPEAAFAERYLYLPSVGACWVIAWACRRLWNAAGLERRAWRVTLASTAAALAALAVLRIVTRNRDWRDEVVLYRRTLAVSPNAYLIHNNLGQVYWKQGRQQLAEQEWRAAEKLAPNTVVVLDNLGVMLTAQQRYADAVRELQRALELVPDDTATHIDLGMAYHAMGLEPDAEREFETAVRLSPLNVFARNRLGEVYFDEGRFADADAQFRASLALEPSLSAWFGLGLSRWRQGDGGEAERDFKNAEALDPSDSRAYFMLGLLYGASGRYAEAVEEYRAGFKIDPANPQALAAFQKLQAEISHAKPAQP